MTLTEESVHTVGGARREGERTVEPIDARVLLGHALGLSHAGLLAREDRPLSGSEWGRFRDLIARRETGEPVAYIIGEREFRGLAFIVTPDVLVPRPETEHVVEHALSLLRAGERCRVLDLATGSGAIAVTLARERPELEVSAGDISASALEVARRNAALHGARIRFCESDWFSAFESESFRLIVANPPYVAAADPHLRRGDLPFEPALALVAGADGMACIRIVADEARGHLEPEGWLVLEHGYDQRGACVQLLRELGYTAVKDFDDLAGHPRVCIAQWRD